MRARAASSEDAKAIARIYNEGIEERIATFETSPRAARKIQAWFDGTHPVVVVEEEGEVISFANVLLDRFPGLKIGGVDFGNNWALWGPRKLMVRL